MEYLLAEYRELAQATLLPLWFPVGISSLIQDLCSMKPLGKDLGALLGVILLAGIDPVEEPEYFTAFLEEMASDYPVIEPQNLSSFLFGITTDEVSKSESFRCDQTSFANKLASRKPVT